VDHDQRLKTLLREFFELFFPERAARFDFTRIEFLTQEILSDPPEGERRGADADSGWAEGVAARGGIASHRPVAG